MGEILVQDQRIDRAGFTKSLGSQHTTVAPSARTPVGGRVVAAVRQAVVETQLEAAADDVGLAERDQRRLHAKGGAFDARARPERRERLERADELGPKI